MRPKRGANEHLSRSVGGQFAHAATPIASAGADPDTKPRECPFSPTRDENGAGPPPTDTRHARLRDPHSHRRATKMGPGHPPTDTRHARLRDPNLPRCARSGTAVCSSMQSRSFSATMDEQSRSRKIGLRQTPLAILRRHRPPRRRDSAGKLVLIAPKPTEDREDAP